MGTSHSWTDSRTSSTWSSRNEKSRVRPSCDRVTPPGAQIWGGGLQFDGRRQSTGAVRAVRGDDGSTAASSGDGLMRVASELGFKIVGGGRPVVGGGTAVW
jgi:hypothetical protein